MINNTTIFQNLLKIDKDKIIYIEKLLIHSLIDSIQPSIFFHFQLHEYVPDEIKLLLNFKCLYIYKQIF